MSDNIPNMSDHIPNMSDNFKKELLKIIADKRQAADDKIMQRIAQNRKSIEEFEIKLNKIKQVSKQKIRPYVEEANEILSEELGYNLFLNESHITNYENTLNSWKNNIEGQILPLNPNYVIQLMISLVKNNTNVISNDKSTTRSAQIIIQFYTNNEEVRITEVGSRNKTQPFSLNQLSSVLIKEKISDLIKSNI